MDTVISAVRTPRKWVLLTPYHLSEHLGRGRKRGARWIPLSMITAIEFRARRRWYWRLLSLLSAGLALARIVLPHQFAWLDPTAPWLASAVFYALYLFTSWYCASFLAPNWSIEVAVPLSCGRALHRFCMQVLKRQEQLSGAPIHEELGQRGDELLLPAPGRLPPARHIRPMRRRRTLTASRWS
jgi:hypothetical protein